MRKNIYFNEDTDKLLVDLSKSLNRNMSDVIKIALERYKEEMQVRSMKEFRLCHDQLSKSIDLLQACRDYGPNEGNLSPEPWTDQDDEILNLLFNAFDPLMSYNNYLVRSNHPDWFNEGD